MNHERPERVSIFATCLVDAIAPRAGIATVNLLERLGFSVDFPCRAVCCGQPAFNTGYPDEARRVARPLLEAFANAQAVVCPSGSCTAMVRNAFGELFATDTREHEQAVALAGKIYELSEFLVRVAGITDTHSSFHGTVVYHPSCHLTRELGIAEEPLRLLESVAGLKRVPLENDEECCGFGGTFSIKHPRLSGAMVCNKVNAILRSGAEVVVACDSGCLMSIEGALQRNESSIRTLHLAEVLETAQ